MLGCSRCWTTPRHRSSSLVMNTSQYSHIAGLVDSGLLRSGVALGMDASPDGPLLELTDANGARARFLVRLERSHLSYSTVESWLASSADVDANLLLLGPYVGPEMGTMLAEAGANYVDLAGNCHFGVQGFGMIHIEGRRPRSAPSPSGTALRTPGQRLLLALLTTPELAGEPVRTIAQVVGVSVGTVSSVCRGLEAEGHLLRRSGRRVLVLDEALLERWMVEARTLLPRLERARLRVPRSSDPEVVEDLVARRLEAAGVEWGWGGGPAAFRLGGTYRGRPLSVYVREPLPLPERMLGLPADPGGDLVVRPAPVPAALGTVEKHVAHPVLVYPELAFSRLDRAQEAAAEVRRTHMPWAAA